MSSSEYARTRRSPQERHALLRAQSLDMPVPGMLAYVDSIPAGWCGFGVREQMMRLVKSRTIPAPDGVGVWSIVCFAIRVGYRRRGLARELLHGVIDYAREHGAPALEAYPIDPHGRRVHATAVYVGTTTLFEEAGFERVIETDARSARLPRWLMRLDLRST